MLLYVVLWVLCLHLQRRNPLSGAISVVTCYRFLSFGGFFIVKDFWQRVLDLLCGRIDAKIYESWIKPIAFGRLAGNDLFVEVPDPFFKDWLETHYAPTIREAAREITQKDISLFVTDYPGNPE